MPGNQAPIIRPYRAEDVPALRACIVELQDAERRIDDRLSSGESMADGYLEQLFKRCQEWAGTMLVAECDGMVGGFVGVLARVPYEELDEPPGDYALVSDLVVREPFRRRGVGEALLQEAAQWAAAAGAKELRIGVLSGNENAKRLYRRGGFAPYLEILAKRIG